MSLTISEAKQGVVDIFEKGWSALGLNVDNIIHQGKPGGAPSCDDATGNELYDNTWCRFLLVHTTFFKETVSNREGISIFNRNAILTVQLFYPLGDGTNDNISQGIVDIFESQHDITGLWFRNVTPREIGATDNWFQVNIECDVIYDQIK